MNPFVFYVPFNKLPLKIDFKILIYLKALKFYLNILANASQVVTAKESLNTDTKSKESCKSTQNQVILIT